MSTRPFSQPQAEPSADAAKGKRQGDAAGTSTEFKHLLGRSRSHGLTSAVNSLVRRVARLSRAGRTAIANHTSAKVLRALPVLAKLGFASRGLLYIVIAALAAEAGGANGAQGAINSLGTGIGKGLVALLLVGFGGYSGWRFLDGVLGIDHPGWSKKAMFKRLGSLVSGGIHLMLANQCFGFLVDPGEWTGEMSSAAASIARLGLLWLALLLASAAITFAATLQLIKAWKASFLSHFEPGHRKPWLRSLGRIGYSARGLALLWLGCILLLGALDPSHARVGGVGLAVVSASGLANSFLAAGLAVFGIYCFAEARFRHVSFKASRQRAARGDLHPARSGSD